MKHSLTDMIDNRSLNWISACQLLEQQGLAYCVATVIGEVGSVPRSSGAKMVISAHNQYDTLGGGNLEQQVINKARSSLHNANVHTDIVRFALAADLAQCCGGAVQVLFEYFNTQKPHVAIIGAGHVCQALAPIVKSLHCHLKVIDKRTDWLAPLSSLGIDTLQTDNIEEMIASLPDNTHIVIMTHDHTLDFELCKLALEAQRFPYIGLIGSEGKKQRFMFRLKEQLSNTNLAAQLICPVGHPDIKGKLPMEVAVSIAAQLVPLLQQEQNDMHELAKSNQHKKEMWKKVNAVTIDN